MIAIWKHIQDWYRNNRKTLRVSLLVSLAITIFSYEVANSLQPMAGEYAAQKQINDFRKFLGLQQGHVPDSILFINVCYDKTLIPYEEQGMPVGNTVITDREKLLSLLTEAKRANNYRYIFMDVCFEEGLETEADSALFHTIASMDRIVIPEHKGVPLADKILYTKTANADYAVTWQQLTFAHYQFLHDDSIPSVALRIYADRNHREGNAITPHWGGLWYSDNGRLCQNGATLFMNIRINGSLLDAEGQELERNYIYLGADLLDLNEVIPIKEQIKDKILVIGDFKGDVHTTYAGPQPGSSLCINAYLMLMEGKHFVNWPNIFIMFIIYTSIGLFYLRGTSFQTLFANPWTGVLMSFFSTATLFFVIAIIAFWHDVAFNMWVPTTIYSLIDTYVQKRNLYKNKKKNEKTHSAPAT
jgi:hypothetical protein